MTRAVDLPVVHTTFIVPVRNDARALHRCLQSIGRQARDSAGIQIIVVDNGSTDASVAVARAQGVNVLEIPGLKVGELRNKGAAAAGGDILAFVDADHEIGPGWIDAAVGALHRPDVGAVGCAYSAPADANWVQRTYDAFRRHPSDVRAIEWLGAGNMAVRSQAFRQVGGFDATLEACEDVDFCQRLRAAGFILLSVPQMESIHYGDPASLRTLFFSELWRGRDNFRVTLRGPLTFASLPSLMMPIANLIALAAIVAGPIVFRSINLALLGVTVLFLTVALRTVRLLVHLRGRTPLDLIRTFFVALAYESARALALIARTPHRRAHRGLTAGTAR